MKFVRPLPYALNRSQGHKMSIEREAMRCLPKVSGLPLQSKRFTRLLGWTSLELPGP